MRERLAARKTLPKEIAAIEALRDRDQFFWPEPYVGFKGNEGFLVIELAIGTADCGSQWFVLHMDSSLTRIKSMASSNDPAEAALIAQQFAETIARQHTRVALAGLTGADA
jgi:hypothetical protein